MPVSTINSQTHLSDPLSVACDSKSVIIVNSNQLPKLYKQYKNSIWEKQLASNLFKVEILYLAYFITKAGSF